MDWRRTTYFLIGLIIGAIFHEYMHGKIADLRGDPTARNAGRLTLNPIAHVDPIGTLLMPILLLVLSGGRFAFAYAKPVPVNPFFLRKPRRDMMLIALSGPLTNFAIALFISLLALLLRVVFNLSFYAPQGVANISGSGGWVNLFELLFYIAVINVVLGFFNLIPVPPLDGSHVLSYFLPPDARRAYNQISRYGFLIIILFIYLLGGVFFSWMNPIFSLIERVIFGPVSFAL